MTDCNMSRSSDCHFNKTYEQLLVKVLRHEREGQAAVLFTKGSHARHTPANPRHPQHVRVLPKHSLLVVLVAAAVGWLITVFCAISSRSKRSRRCTANLKLNLPISAIVFINRSLTIHQSTMKLLSVTLALLVASASAFAPTPMGRAVTTSKMAASEELYIDDERRFLMNLIVVGSTAVTVGAFGIPYIAFFFPPGAGGGAGGIPAKNALGDDLIAKEYLASKPAGDRSLAQGLKGDAT